MAFTIAGIENYILFFLLLLLSIVFANLVSTIVRTALERRTEKKYAKIVSRVVQYTIIFIGIEFGLYFVLDVQVGSLLASLGIAGIVIGFASQQLIQNFLAGFVISIDRLIELEDWVAVGGIPDTGVLRVKDIGLMRTVLRSVDGQLVYIPNSALMGGKLINYTQSGFVKNTFSIAVKSDQDFLKVKKIILDVLGKYEKILPNVSAEKKKDYMRLLEVLKLGKYFERKVDPKDFVPRVVIMDLSDGKMALEVEYWVMEISNSKYVKSEILRLLKEEFDEQKIRLA
ncbi:hypothetical protein A3K63_04140 [Candidatus Micrarchaeota archaeon RBG_16_49_10]|nr:MAG: hypothetical protein A3K63_04140 [Candidatus Micrarchaeota archaeon RBG_16_49_10]